MLRRFYALLYNSFIYKPTYKKKKGCPMLCRRILLAPSCMRLLKAHRPTRAVGRVEPFTYLCAFKRRKRLLSYAELSSAYKGRDNNSMSLRSLLNSSILTSKKGKKGYAEPSSAYKGRDNNSMSLCLLLSMVCKKAHTKTTYRLLVCGPFGLWYG